MCERVREVSGRGEALAVSTRNEQRILAMPIDLPGRQVFPDGAIRPDAVRYIGRLARAARTGCRTSRAVPPFSARPQTQRQVHLL